MIAGPLYARRGSTVVGVMREMREKRQENKRRYFHCNTGKLGVQSPGSHRFTGFGADLAQARNSTSAPSREGTARRSRRGCCLVVDVCPLEHDWLCNQSTNEFSTYVSLTRWISYWSCHLQPSLSASGPPTKSTTRSSFVAKTESFAMYEHERSKICRAHKAGQYMRPTAPRPYLPA